MLILCFLLMLGIFWAIIHFSILKAIKEKPKRWGLSLIVFVLPILVVSSIKLIKGFVPVPVWLRHACYSIWAPADLCQPIKRDNFSFSQKGFTRTYPLRPKYLGTYCIGAVCESRTVPMPNRVPNRDVWSLFDGVLRAEFYWKDKFLFERVLSGQRIASITTGSYESGDDEMHYIDKVGFVWFDIPLDGKYINDITVKLTVLKPYEKLATYEDSMLLFIGFDPWAIDPWIRF